MGGDADTPKTQGRDKRESRNVPKGIFAKIQHRARNDKQKTKYENTKNKTL